MFERSRIFGKLMNRQLLQQLHIQNGFKRKMAMMKPLQTKQRDEPKISFGQKKNQATYFIQKPF